MLKKPGVSWVILLDAFFNKIERKEKEKENHFALQKQT